jgi:glycerol-3-phosphate dehydrogenase
VKRDLSQLARKKYQVLVVGGGIYGVCVAWDAALRGLSVALIERGDFGSGTSANSLKIIHGGLRYLQDVNPKRVRKMAAERSTWLRIAPHLVHPLACLTPTYPELSRSKMVLTTALALNDLISYDLNRSLDRGRWLPESRTISRQECLNLLGDTEIGDITGGVIWYDGQIYNSERLLLSFVLSASQIGAEVANYVEGLSFIGDDANVRGVRAKDVLTGDEFDIQAELVVNCSGVWIDSLLSKLDAISLEPRYFPSIAINLITRRMVSDYAIGLPGKTRTSSLNEDQREHTQMLFFVPWRGYTLIGTKHFIGSSPSASHRLPDLPVTEFVNEVNQAFPGMNLSGADVLHVHWGYLPLVKRSPAKAGLKLLRDSRVVDHRREDGIDGLVTVVGVKFTTARATAQQAVDLIVGKLGARIASCRTYEAPIYGGNIEHFDDYLAGAQTELAPLFDGEVIEHLVTTYGGEYQRLLRYLDVEPPLGERVLDASPVIKAEIIHAVREEMTLTLSDVVRRRTELGAAGLPDSAGLRSCAETMGKELGWRSDQIENEIAAVVSSYPMTVNNLDATGKFKSR